jgi:hypothetical protein
VFTGFSAVTMKGHEMQLLTEEMILVEDDGLEFCVRCIDTTARAINGDTFQTYSIGEEIEPRSAYSDNPRDEYVCNHCQRVLSVEI